MKFLGNAVLFVLVYLLFMLPTYLLPWIAGSNSVAMNALSTAAAEDWGGASNPGFMLHALSFVVLIVFTYFRGVLIGKKWLLIFPVLAAFFDFTPGLSLIPFVPTAMHLLAIILGVAGTTVALAPRKEREVF
jgi:hypothetical protein